MSDATPIPVTHLDRSELAKNASNEVIFMLHFKETESLVSATLPQ